MWRYIIDTENLKKIKTYMIDQYDDWNENYDIFQSTLLEMFDEGLIEFED